ncbi:unnamed protein product [Echinostoma caproni]|uniref:DUF1618 domain-containing protein n=1 Tax=Echinostoma caproni TaxID=27848 RepID=A0A183AZ26_9TREM|nr:unnamed protein product [Echinostoma caproni]
MAITCVTQAQWSDFANRGAKCAVEVNQPLAVFYSTRLNRIKVVSFWPNPKNAPRRMRSHVPDCPIYAEWILTVGDILQTDNRIIDIVGALQGFHFAAFTVDTKSRPEWKALISLVEDQGVDCLDADNPDCWTVRVHAALTRSNSFPRRGRMEPTTAAALTDSPLVEQPEIGSSPTNVSGQKNGTSPLNGTNGTQQKPRMKIGRVNAVCLSRNVVGTQRVKRDPREMFREDVISISNRQQEAKMKRSANLTGSIEQGTNKTKLAQNFQSAPCADLSKLFYDGPIVT